MQFRCGEGERGSKAIQYSDVPELAVAAILCKGVLFQGTKINRSLLLHRSRMVGEKRSTRLLIGGEK